ncbi:MAG: RhuM family protein [Dysgonamonadaceae bacterium]
MLDKAIFAKHFINCIAVVVQVWCFKKTISEHLGNIYKYNKFQREATVRKIRTVQNELHWAITGQTAAEIISSRVKAKLQNMGLTVWLNYIGRCN